MKDIAVFAGSFSPFTKGHEDIVRKILPLFEKIYIAIGHNYNKKDVFSVEQRMKWIEQLYSMEPKVEVVAYEGLTVDLCAKLGAGYLVRGVRGAADCQQEQEMYLACPQCGDPSGARIPTMDVRFLHHGARIVATESRLHPFCFLQTS